MEEGNRNIYETITAVMSDIGSIGKEQVNQQQGFRYRGIDDVMNALSPAFIKHRLFIVPEVLEQRREERQTTRGGNLIYSICRVKYTFYASDGSNISAVVVGEGMDSGDKASNKALAVAFKYACFQVFCIPTKEMLDPDAECHETASNRITKDQVDDLLRECDRTGMPWKNICKMYGVNQFSDMNSEQYQDCMARFRHTKDKGEQNGEQRKA